MPDRKDERTTEQQKPEETRDRAPGDGTPNAGIYETAVSDINTDPDAGFDFDMNPTDEENTPHSER